MSKPAKIDFRSQSHREKSPTERFWLYVEKPRNPKHCWKWIGTKDSKGYSVITIKGKVVKGHRFSFFIHNGYWPNSACHRCDNPPCCNPKHLFNGNHADNMLDAARKGRFPKGKNHWTRKNPELMGDFKSQSAWMKNRWRNHRNEMLAEGLKHRRFGTDNNKAKLTTEKVIQIRLERSRGRTNKSIGLEFGVTESTISRIVRREIWNHV